ncbi:FtsW/RodA/SpoVE family cell cycle protein [Cetobacterium sp. SF1]|uniref:FtsW/RodA/SpoVE family cell cycle protein n=1 Tax=Cetobacterium sp. SF1 TaxID=3417654 RepID=UPI003CEFC491
MNSGSNSLYHERNVLMKEKALAEEKVRKRRRRVAMMIMTGLLCLLSGINIYSASFFSKPEYPVRHWIFIGMFLFIYYVGGLLWNSRKYNYKFLENSKFTWPICLIVMPGILALVGILGRMGIKSIVPEINGAYGWIRVAGINLQPSEIGKLTFIIIIAKILSNCEKTDAGDKTILSTTGIVLVAYCAGLILEHDMGTALHYGAIWLFMIFMSKLSKKLILWGAIGSSTLGSLFLWIAYRFLGQGEQGYKLRRIISYIDGLFYNNYESDTSYQVKQSVYAFGSGGLLGKGYGNGIQKYSYLPEIHTDFVMATFGEEFGLVGIMFVMCIFYFIFIGIIHTAMETKDDFGKFLAIGIGGMLMTQVIINIFVAVGLMPVFGIPMPLFSYGGTSMLNMALAFLLIHNINKTA